MFWNKKPDPAPHGVRLTDLTMALAATDIQTSRQGDTLLAKHDHYTVRVEVIPPEVRESENGRVKAVVRITCDIPKNIAHFFNGKEAEVATGFNAFAALGALTYDQGRLYVGSRLTIYEQEDAWETLHMPLILFTTIGGTEAILGGMRRAFNKQAPRQGDSEWTVGEFEEVEKFLSRMCVCTGGGKGITAEFPLVVKGGVSAVAGDKTALFQLTGDQPHPEFGGGLFSMLQMPHQFADENRLHRVCMQLNTMEMSAGDQPPHFGAWCGGKLGDNPAYVSFYPNALHSVPNLATNAAVWALNRAEYANRMLGSIAQSN